MLVFSILEINILLDVDIQTSPCCISVSRRAELLAADEEDSEDDEDAEDLDDDDDDDDEDEEGDENEEGEDELASVNG
jgi:hypothetical protein